MDFKNYKLSVLGKEIPINPIEYENRNSSIEGNITIFKDELYSMNMPKLKKISNYQRKKMWKRFLKQFGIDNKMIKSLVNTGNFSIRTSFVEENKPL